MSRAYRDSKASPPRPLTSYHLNGPSDRLSQWWTTSMEETEATNEALMDLHASRYFGLAQSSAFAPDAGTLLCELSFDSRFYQPVVASMPHGGFPSPSPSLARLFGSVHRGFLGR